MALWTSLSQKRLQFFFSLFFCLWRDRRGEQISVCFWNGLEETCSLNTGGPQLRSSLTTNEPPFSSYYQIMESHVPSTSADHWGLQHVCHSDSAPAAARRRSPNDFMYVKKLTVWLAEMLCCWFLPRILESGSWVSVETYSQAVHPIRIMDYKKSAGHYLQARSVILWMLTLLLPGSWCFYYINNVAGAIHHTDMRLLIMSVPCIFPPFSSKEERGRGRQEMEE